MSTKHVDVIIVGAGLSGIGAAYHLQTKSPNKSYAILEGRSAMGGTWDLFKYPGIRSDSDMHTLGYAFKPWKAQKAIADGPSILNYIKETAAENNIEERIIYETKVTGLSWSSDNAQWLVDSVQGEAGEQVQMSCNFIFMCSGYYDYAGGFIPDFENLKAYKGKVVHPQQWPEDLDYTDKKVVVIGSGATAVTLVPSMAEKAAHVTMLQRSPTYMASRPAADNVANTLRKYLPEKLAYGITRWKNVLFGMYFFNYSKRKPNQVAELLIDGVKDLLTPGYDVKKHFTPHYKPWDQRLCLVPDGDMFDAINNGRVSVVTDHIDRFSETGVKLKSGDELDADIVVMATGLKLQVLSGVSIQVDGEAVDMSEALTYKGMMFSGLPNLALSMGYTNASWTLKSDLTGGYVCRLLNYMDQHHFDFCCPVNNDENLTLLPFMDLKSGYVTRLIDTFPKQAEEKPWRLNQNYARDLMALAYGSLEDDAMQFGKAKESEAVAIVHTAA